MIEVHIVITLCLVACGDNLGPCSEVSADSIVPCMGEPGVCVDDEAGQPICRAFCASNHHCSPGEYPTILTVLSGDEVCYCAPPIEVQP